MTKTVSKTKKKKRGKDRFNLEKIGSFGTSIRVKFEIKVRAADDPDRPLTVEFWYKDIFGKNHDLGKGSDLSFTISLNGFDTAWVRGWRKHHEDIIISYTMSGG